MNEAKVRATIDSVYEIAHGAIVDNAHEARETAEEDLYFALLAIEHAIEELTEEDLD